LALENFALRQQLAVWKARQPPLRLTEMDRIFWVLLSRLWRSWWQSLQVVRPETVVDWRRQGFKRYWARKSPEAVVHDRDGAARVDSANEPRQPALGRAEDPRRAAEAGPNGIAGNGVEVHARPPPPAVAGVANVSKESRPGCDRYGFLHGAHSDLPVLFVLVVLSYARRRLVHFNVTEHPTAERTARQLLEACGLEEVPRYVIRDRDQVYGERFSRQAKTLDIWEAVIAPRSPWQNAYAERVIGSIRRECLDHVVVIGERHLLGFCRSTSTTTTGPGHTYPLAKDAPRSRSVQLPSQGRVVKGAPRRWTASRILAASGVSRREE
jgi:putative transposase